MEFIHPYQLTQYFEHFFFLCLCVCMLSHLLIRTFKAGKWIKTYHSSIAQCARFAFNFIFFLPTKYCLLINMGEMKLGGRIILR